MIDINYFQTTLLILFYVHAGMSVYSMYIHRGLSHGAVTYNQQLVKLFQCWLWLFGILANRYRVASHKLHHKYSDTSFDVNGPKVLGKFTILLIKPVKRFVGIFLAPFKKSNFVENTELEKIVCKTPDTGFFHKNIMWGVWANLLLHFVLFGISGIAIWIAVMFMTQWLAFAFGDGIIHLYGYRNFNTNECSKNVFPLAILLGGEELHNNHHYSPSRAKFSKKWWEVDISWFYICILVKLNLAKIDNK